MSFNELNSVEHFIIRQLSGVDLNSNTVAEPQSAYGVQWQYLPASELLREQSEYDDRIEVQKAQEKPKKHPRISKKKLSE